MVIMKSLNLLIRFFLEIGVVISVGYWGFHLKNSLPIKLVLGIGLPILIMIIWGTFIAPNSSRQLELVPRLIAEVIVFGTGVAALFASGFSMLGKLFSAVVIINMILLFYWKQ